MFLVSRQELSQIMQLNGDSFPGQNGQLSLGAMDSCHEPK